MIDNYRLYLKIRKIIQSINFMAYLKFYYIIFKKKIYIDFMNIMMDFFFFEDNLLSLF